MTKPATQLSDDDRRLMCDPDSAAEGSTPHGSVERDPLPRPFRMVVDGVPFAAISLGLAAWLYRIWDVDWSQPLRWGSDATLIQAMVKTIATNGWYLHNPNLNAPFGQQFYDFPSGGESLQFVALRFVSLFTQSPGATMNVYYIGGFAALTLVTYVVVRSLRFSWLTAGAVAVLYSFLPYHFGHSQYHLYRSTYLSAPIAALLILWALSWRTVFLVDPSGPVWGAKRLWHNLRRGAVIGSVALCAFIGTFETMTIAFFLTILVVASALVAIRNRDWGHLFVAVFFTVVCALTFAATLSPNLRFWSANGSNPVAARRFPSEQERYGLQPSQMMLPVPDHRIEAVRHLEESARDDSPIAGERGEQLGILGASGLLVLLAFVLTRGIPRFRHNSRRSPRVLWDRSTLLRHAGLCAVIAILFGTVSGFALVLSVLGTSQVRVWNRIVILIAFWALLPIATFFDWLLRRWATGPKRMGAIALIVLLSVIGIYDTAVPYPQGGGIANLTEAKAFITEMDAALPQASRVFQFPVRRFPEEPAQVNALPYDDLIPYVMSDTSKDFSWSAGGIKGRPDADWQQRIDSQRPTTALPGLVGLGFDSVLVDTYAYAPAKRPAIASQLTAALGEPLAVSSSGRWQLWDMQSFAAEHGYTAAQTRHAAEELVGPQFDNVSPKD